VLFRPCPKGEGGRGVVPRALCRRDGGSQLPEMNQTCHHSCRHLLDAAENSGTRSRQISTDLQGARKNRPCARHTAKAAEGARYSVPPETAPATKRTSNHDLLPRRTPKGSRLVAPLLLPGRYMELDVPAPGETVSFHVHPDLPEIAYRRGETALFKGVYQINSAGWVGVPGFIVCLDCSR